MNRPIRKAHSLRCCSMLEVKSKYGAEFRRFSVDRYEPGRYKDFYRLIVRLHQLWHTDVFIGYADVHGELLPINNDDNFCKAVSSTQSLLRIFIQLREEAEQCSACPDDMTKRKKSISHRKPAFQISKPHNFRPVSSIIDVDLVPESHRRVRLYRQNSDRPLGFFIRDGTTVTVTPYGLEKRPGVFISRIVPGGLAACTGLLALNDQVLEVNGIEVSGKTLDQVTDMMIANSHNLIITVKPANQHNNITRKSCASSTTGHYFESTESVCYPGLPMIMKAYGFNGSESEEDVDLVIERPVKHQYSSPHVSTSYRPQVAPGRPNSLLSAASFRSQPCLACTGHTGLRSVSDRQDYYGFKAAIRQESCSSGDVRNSWQVDLSSHLLLPQGAMEEDGIVVFL
ncbi:par-6 family cell polarity regulator gamma a [Danio rerio]|uniref:Par-6 family cell polarity regulator gamma a n=2 Tax=Danio rerio TaxID=7955 RepID=B3DJX7_DANRE|nr:par-6 family cell polarity regulator gamma a [Danio rerio]AAI63645.1 Zgc:194441 protein [Danio rerio]|eukprot:NP_001124131.1 partitioning defective 6 homolog gamma [Danio rerio]